jgi:hypothetical protein
MTGSVPSNSHTSGSFETVYSDEEEKPEDYSEGEPPVLCLSPSLSIP